MLTEVIVAQGVNRVKIQIRIGLLSLTLIINASLAKELDQSSQNNLTSTWVLDYDFRENQYGWDWSFIQLARETYILGEGFQIERGQNVALSYIFPDLNERPININRVLIEYSFDGDNPVSINAGISADGWFSGAITPSTLTITKGDNLIAFAEGSVNEIIGAPYDRFKITWSTLNNPGSVMTIHRIRFEGTGDAPVIPNYPITNNWVVNYDFRDEFHGWMSDDFTYIPNQGFSLANTKWSRRASMTSPVFPDLNGRSVRFLSMEIEYSMSGLEGGTHNINEIGFANSAGSGGLHRRQTPRLDAASNRTVTLRMNDNITLKDLTTETSGPDSFWFNWWTYSRQATLTIHQIRFGGSGDAPTSISTPCVSEGMGLFSDSCEPPTPTLADFGIILEGESGDWSFIEQAEILQAAVETGSALHTHGVNADSLVGAFRKVLQGEDDGEWRKIRFYRTALSGVYCSTTSFTTGQYSAAIACHPNAIMTQYTAVHEFGHVFVGRTTVDGISSFLGMIENPGPNGGSLYDLAATPNFVMGSRSYNLVRGPSTDWQRSNVIVDNGWGSAALWDQTSYYIYAFPEPPSPTPTAFPFHVPQIGPCGLGAPSLPVPNSAPFPFQQNPCTFPNWEASDPVGHITEIVEAAADMFLNWVYWKNYGIGFLNELWRSAGCYPNGCPDAGLSGQVRGEWMDNVITNLSIEFSW